MWKLFLLTSVLFDHGEALTPGTIAREYLTVTNGRTSDPPEANAVPGEISKRRHKLNKGLVTLLEQGRSLEESALNSDDCIALSEIATRLRQSGPAIDFARLACRKATDVKAYYILVRCLCQGSDFAEARRAAREGIRRCSNGDSLYLLPHTLAIHYRRRGQLAECAQQLDHALIILAQQCAQAYDFSSQLAVCIDERREVGALIEQREDFNDTAQQLLRIVSGEWQRRITFDCCHDAEPDLEDKMRKLAILGRAMITIESRVAPDSIPRRLLEWLDTASACEKSGESFEFWCGGISEACNAIPAALSPDFDVDHLLRRLENIQAQLTESMPETGTAREQLKSLSRRLQATSSLLRQHQAHRNLVGQKLFDPETLDAILEGGQPGFVVVQFMHPLSKDIQKGVQAVQSLRVGPLSQPDIEIAYCVFQAGISLDLQRRQLVLDEHTTVKGEEKALAWLSQSLHLPTPIHLLSKDSHAMVTLSPSIFPINVLMDGHGRLICALTGAEKTKVARLAELANPRSGIRP